MSRTYGSRGVERRKKATPITPREWLLDVSLKNHIDLPQFFLKKNFAKDYAADFKHDLLVKFVLSGQQRGPEVQLPVSKSHNRQNEQTGKISWKHKLCISGQVRQSLPRVCWVRTVEATGLRKLTVKLHTQQQHGQLVQQHKQQQKGQPPGPGQRRIPAPQQQHAGGSLHTQQHCVPLRPQPASTTTSASPARQAAAKLRSAATNRARSSTTQPPAPRTTHTEVELAAKRLRTTSGRVVTGAGAAAGDRRDATAAAAQRANRAGHHSDSDLQRPQTAAADVAQEGGSSSKWQLVNQLVNTSTTSLAVPGNIAALLQTQQKQQQHTRVQVQLLQQSAQLHAAAAPAAVGSAVKKAPAAPGQQQQTPKTSPWLPCQLVAKLSKAVAASQGASDYQVVGTALQQQLRQHTGWRVVSAQLVGASKLRYQLQQQFTAQHQQQQQHAAPEHALPHEQHRQEIATDSPAPAARKRLFRSPADDGSAPKPGPKQQRRHIHSTDPRESPPVGSSSQRRSSDFRSAQAGGSGDVAVQRTTVNQQQRHRQQRQPHVSDDQPPIRQPPPPQQPQQQHTKQQTPGCSTDLPVPPSPTQNSPRMRHRQQQLQEPPELMERLQPVAGEAAVPAVAGADADKGSPASSSSSSDFDKSSDEDFVVSDENDLPTDNYNGYGEVIENLEDLRVLCPGFWTPLRQEQRVIEELGNPPHPEQLQQLQEVPRQQGVQLLQQQHSQQYQQQRRRASGRPAGVQYAESPAAGPVATSGAGQQPSAAGGGGSNSNTSTRVAAGRPNSGDAGGTADGSGGAGGDGDGDGDGGGDDPRKPAAVGSVGSLDSITVDSYFVAVNHHAKGSGSPKVVVRIPKLLVDKCLPQLAMLGVGSSCQIDIQLLLLPGTVEAHALIDAGSEGVVAMGDTQRGTVRAKTKKVGRGDSAKTQPMYQLEDVTSSYAGELWVLGLSTYAGCSGLRLMLSSHNPGKPGPRSKDYVMAVTSDGRVVSAATGIALTPVVVKQCTVAAEPSGLISAPHPAVTATTAAGASNMGGDIAIGEEVDAVPFVAMGQKLDGRSLSLPRTFVQQFMPNLWFLEKGGSQVLDVTLALLPPGVNAASPDSQPVSTQQLKGQVTRTLDRLKLGGHQFTQCNLVRCGQYYAAGVRKLSDTALQVFISDSRPPGKYEALISVTASMELATAEAAPAAAAVEQQDAEEADLAVDDDDESAGMPGVDADPDAAAAAAEVAEQEAAAAQVVEVVPAAAGATTDGLAKLFPVTQSLFAGKIHRPPRLPLSFLLQHFPDALTEAGKTFETGWPLELELVLLPAKVADTTPHSPPQEVVIVHGSRVVTWRHKTAEARDRAVLGGLIVQLRKWAALNKLDSLYLVGLRPLGPKHVQLLFSQELHPGAKRYRFVASAEDRRQRREAATAAVKSPPALKPGEARKPMAGRRLSREGSRSGPSGQLQQQGYGAEAALGRSDSGVSKHERRQQQLAAAGVIAAPVERHRRLSDQALLSVGSEGLPAQSSGTHSDNSRRSKQDQSSPAAALSASAVTSSHMDQQTQQQQRQQSRLGPGSAAQMVSTWAHDLAQYSSQQANIGHVPEASGALQQELADLAIDRGAASAADVNMQDVNDQQQQQQQHSGPGNTQLDAPEAGAAAAAAAASALPDPTPVNNVPIRFSRQTGNYTPRFRWIQLDVGSLWAAAAPDKLLDGDAHRVKVQFVQDGAMVAGPVVCCIKAFSANAANPNKHPHGYVRLHHSCTLEDQQHTLDALIQQYDGYHICAMSAVMTPRNSDDSSGCAGKPAMDLLNLHIEPPHVVTADEHIAQQTEAAPACLPQQQGEQVAAPEPAADAAAAPQQCDQANGPPQQQLLGRTSVSGGIRSSQLDGQLDLQRQQQQQHSHPSAASHQHSGTGGTQEQQLRQPRQHLPRTEHLAAAVCHEECESKPRVVPVKQEADVTNIITQHPRRGVPPLQPHPLQQQQPHVTQMAEIHSPFIAAAAAGGVDGAPMSALQPQLQQQEVVQPHGGSLPGAGASAGSAGGAISSLGGGTSTAGGSASQPQQVKQPEQDPELQLPDSMEFTDDVWDALITSSNKLADMEVISYDEALDFQEMLTPQDGVVPAEATAFMRKHYMLYARNLKKNVKMAATILKRAVDAYKKSQA